MGKKGSIPWNKGMKGIHLSPNSEFKKGIATVQGKHWKIKDTSKMKGRTGEKCHLWKGGITSEYQKIRTSTEYNEWRLKVFTRDNFACQSCGKLASGELEAHHIKSFAKYKEIRFDINNGVTLCKECHKKTDDYLNKGRWI